MVFDRIVRWVRERFQSSSYTVWQGIGLPSSTTESIKEVINEIRNCGNDWQRLCEVLYKRVPEVGGLIDRMVTISGQMVEGATRNERRVIEEGVFNLLVFGNTVHDVSNKQPLPFLTMSILDTDANINRFVGYTINKAKWYVLNEGFDSSDSVEKFKKEDVIHVKYIDTRVSMLDRMGRMTYGLYGYPPLLRTKPLVMWFLQTMLVDVMLRYTMIPREHHKLRYDKSLITYLEGNTLEEKLRRFEQKVNTLLTNYKEKLLEHEPDQGYITTDDVEIVTLDKGRKYVQPNELLTQLSDYMFLALDAPFYSQRGPYASELIKANFLVSKIASLVNKLLVTFGWDHIRFNYVLDVLRTERCRQAVLLQEVGVDVEEIERLLGMKINTEYEEFSKRGRSKGDKTSADVIRDEIRRKNDLRHPDTPSTRESRSEGGEF